MNEALRLAHLMIEDEPTDEGARDLAIRAYLANGDRPAAVREYRRYREFLIACGDEHSAASLDALLTETRAHRA